MINLSVSSDTALSLTRHHLDDVEQETASSRREELRTAALNALKAHKEALREWVETLGDREDVVILEHEAIQALAGDLQTEAYGAFRTAAKSPSGLSQHITDLDIRMASTPTPDDIGELMQRLVRKAAGEARGCYDEVYQAIKQSPVHIAIEQPPVRTAARLQFRSLWCCRRTSHDDTELLSMSGSGTRANQQRLKLARAEVLERQALDMHDRWRALGKPSGVNLLTLALREHNLA